MAMFSPQLKDIECQETIGSGSFGQVYKGTHQGRYGQGAIYSIGYVDIAIAMTYK